METAKLWPGLIAASPVRHPHRPEIELVMPGIELEQRMIDNLRRLGVPAIWVHWPGMDFLDTAVQDKAMQVRDDIFAALKKDFEQTQKLTVGLGHYLRYSQLISRLAMQLLGAERGGLAVQTAGLFDGNGELFRHSANVAYLSLTFGMRMETYVTRERRYLDHDAARNLTNLGIGAMLHDVGKLHLPETREMHEPLTGPADWNYQSHVTRGWATVHDRVSAVVKAIILHHHQRWDGKGFPKMDLLTDGRQKGALAERDIHVFARIVHLCDVFDHLCRDENNKARPVVAALHELVCGDLHDQFDPKLLRGFFQHIPPFSLGVQVRLNDGAEAAVITLNREQPCRPVVRLLNTPEGRHEDIDLAETPAKWITHALGESVEPWLFTLPPATVPVSGWSRWAKVNAG